MRSVLILLKILAVSVYVGGLATVLGLWIASDFASLDLSDPRRQLVLDQVSRLMVFLVVPALLVALIVGAILLSRSPHYFAARWMKIKLISLAILIPAGHLYCRSRMLVLKHTTDPLTSDHAAMQFKWGLTAALIGSIWIVILGRLKPRFGTTSSSPSSPTNREAKPSD